MFSFNTPTSVRATFTVQNTSCPLDSLGTPNGQKFQKKKHHRPKVPAKIENLEPMDFLGIDVVFRWKKHVGKT